MSAFIFYFLIMNKLIQMTGDFKLSLDIFYKKKRVVSGIDNPNTGIEGGSGVSASAENDKTQATVVTLEVRFCHADMKLSNKCCIFFSS